MFSEIENTKRQMLLDVSGWLVFGEAGYPGRRKLYLDGELRLVETSKGEYRRYKNGRLTFINKRLNVRTIRHLHKRGCKPEDQHTQEERN